MIHGHLKEATQGYANLNEVSEATFAHFVRWLYTGDYRATPHIVNGNEANTSVPATPVEIADDDWSGWGTTKKKKKKKEQICLRLILKEKFISSETHVDDGVKSGSMGTIRSNKSPEEEHTAVFLSHANLYVFAEKYDIQDLKQLALTKLRHSLATFTLYETRTEDILGLLRYVFSETAPTRPGEQNIRSMLMLYVATEMEILQEQDEFREMLAEDPEMMKDFLATLTTSITEKNIVRYE